MDSDYRRTGNDEVVSDPTSPAARDDAQEAEKHLKRLRAQHRFDPFMDLEKLDAIDSAIETGNAEKEMATEDSLIGENSPYAEVRTAVVPTDDPDMYVDTIRAWTIGFITCTIVAAMNIIMGQHYTGLQIQPPVVQLIAYPMGKGWELFMPNIKIFGAQLNPGPFNKKEHTIITMMTAAGAAASYAFYILIAQQVYYGQKWGWGFQISLTLATQALGFGLAGLMRRFLVWPAAMVWPATLITCTVMDSLHNHALSDPSQSNGWSIGRYKFFLIVAACTFCWEWFPLAILPFLSYLGAFPTWIAPNNVIVNQVFGGATGLGLFPITLDWSTPTGWFLSPLMYPTFALLNMGFGGLLFFFGTIGLGFAGADFYKYLPLISNTVWDRYAEPYNITRVVTPDVQLDVAAYEAYSPLFLGSAFALAYAMGFANLISNVVHVALFYGKDVWARFRDANYEEPDIHLKLIRKYKECPEWWFSIIFAVSFALGMVAALVWNTHLTWWAYIIAILIGAFFVLPVGVIQAVTNTQTGLNLITEVIVGYMLPGRPVAMMMFKNFGYMFAYNCLQYVSDMKVGHYMKIPPRSLFRAQFFAVVWLSIVQVSTFNWVLGNIKDVCSPDQAQGFTCSGATTFFNASVIWGLIGPRRLFGAGATFAWTNWFWLLGAGLPCIQYFLARKYPKSIARYVFWPAIFGVSGMIPPATTFQLFSWLLIGLFFNVFIKRKYYGWWKRYIYVLSGSLDIGTAFALTLFAIALGISLSSIAPWWGNTAYASTLDMQEMAVTKVLAPGEGYGPSSWS
ncbi:Tetrapeptide transporter, OPT1/isp4 [Xylariales sp. PMI_506]|nr:Tetrapeptide transporter, OPT1/isp4 [Xylariales sp. PMI_506]